jgi:hypothetical protein
MMTKQLRIPVLALFCLTAIAACDQQGTNAPEASTASAASNLAMTVDAAALPDKAARRYEESNAEAKIRQLVAASLRSTGRWSDDMSITVTLDDFRLRTAGAVAMVGAMSGADRISADVSFHKGGQLVKKEKVAAMSRQGGMVGAKEEMRLDGLVTTFAQNFAQLLCSRQRSNRGFLLARASGDARACTRAPLRDGSKRR